jgi:hypothetical protein
MSASLGIRNSCRALLLLSATFTTLITTARLAAAQDTHSTQETRIEASVSVFVDPKEPLPVQKAANDLKADLFKVFGREPVSVTQMKDFGKVVLVIGEAINLPAEIRCASSTGRESFAFSVRSFALPNREASQVLCLSGADMRGVIYAIYEFSRAYLGIDPMYLWTDKMPSRRVTIAIPTTFEKTYRGPAFRYRGFFINDEDLLTGWAPAKNGEQSGISLAVWDNIYETILRLKGDMVVPGTWIFPDDAQIHLATERGLVISQHHAMPVGLNVARWPAGVTYNFTTDSGTLAKAWTNAVRSYQPDEEILWTVGLRGLSDIGYDSMDSSVRGNDKALGELISKAIATQMSIVRKVRPDAEFISDLWQEGARLMRAGYLTVPPEVTLVWADTGYGVLQDNGAASAGNGVYYHVAMMNFEANQLSEMVPVSRIYSELGRFEKAKATGYLLLNTSDIRPVAMTAQAVMDTGWYGAPAETADADRTYYQRWSAEEYGARSAEAVAAVYRDYFTAPAVHGEPKREYGDQFYHTEIRKLLLDTMTEAPIAFMPDQAPKWETPHLMDYPDAPQVKARIDSDIELCEAAEARWDAVWQEAVQAESLVASPRRDYYQASVLTMIQINRQSNRALLLVARALKDAHEGHRELAQRDAREALEALDEIQQAKSKAEYGKWKNWYRGDWLTGVSRTQEVVQAYANYLADPFAKLLAPIDWTAWEAYHYILEYQGDRVVDVH